MAFPYISHILFESTVFEIKLNTHVQVFLLALVAMYFAQQVSVWFLFELFN